jgi:hypothetical protein
VPNLVICVEGSASEDDAAACRETFTELTLDDWTYEPQLVDQIDAIPVSAPDQLPALRSVGMLLALPEPEADVDEQAVRYDVSRLVGTMSDLARRARIEFVVEYREEEVGSLDGSDRDGRFIEDFFGL